jgi:hypothetical protein
MRKILIAVVAAATIGTTALATSGPADAWGWRGGWGGYGWRGGWGGGYGWRGGWGGYGWRGGLGYRGWGYGAAGFAAGAVVGAAIAAPYYGTYYGYAPTYYAVPSYYGYVPTYYAPVYGIGGGCGCCC